MFNLCGIRGNYSSVSNNHMNIIYNLIILVSFVVPGFNEVLVDVNGDVVNPPQMYQLIVFTDTTIYNYHFFAHTIVDAYQAAKDIKVYAYNNEMLCFMTEYNIRLIPFDSVKKILVINMDDYISHPEIYKTSLPDNFDITKSLKLLIGEQ